MTTIQLPLEKVFPNPSQPRKRFNHASLQELAQSIKEHGLIQPIVVEETKNGYMLVAGERRLRAHQLAGLTTIEAVIRERSNHNGREILLSAIIENVQREDMNPIDEAQAYQLLKKEHDLSVNEIAFKVGVNPARVDVLLKLLQLEPRVQELIRDGKLTHDRRAVVALLKVPNAEMQIALAEKAVTKKYTIKAILVAAEKVCEVLHESKSDRVAKTKTPALKLARGKSTDEECKPTNWDALVQLGKVPAWELVIVSAKKTCGTCELRDIASQSTCGRCPAVVMLEALINKAGS